MENLYYKQLQKEQDDYQKLKSKATPIKAKEIYVDAEHYIYDWRCPRCGKSHINNSPRNYCSNCGQKIDWSKYE